MRREMGKDEKKKKGGKNASRLPFGAGITLVARTSVTVAAGSGSDLSSDHAFWPRFTARAACVGIVHKHIADSARADNPDVGLTVTGWQHCFVVAVVTSATVRAVLPFASCGAKGAETCFRAVLPFASCGAKGTVTAFRAGVPFTLGTAEVTLTVFRAGVPFTLRTAEVTLTFLGTLRRFAHVCDCWCLRCCVGGGGGSGDAVNLLPI